MPRPEELAQLVFLVRGEKVMFDADLAKLYGVSTKALNQAMNRNKARFPEDFAFRFITGRIQGYAVTDCDLIWPSLEFEVTDCDLKFPRRPSPAAVRIHRTRRRHAFERPAQRARGRGKYCHYAHFCAAAAAHGFQP